MTSASAITMSQNAEVRAASPARQSALSRAAAAASESGVGELPETGRERDSALLAPGLRLFAAEVSDAPSGCKPMSEGLRRMMSRSGMTMSRGHCPVSAEGGAPACGYGDEGEYLDVDCAAEGTRHRGDAEREIAAAAEEVDCRGAGHDADQHGVGDGARDDVCDVELPDGLYAGEREEADAGDERREGHEAARPVAVGEPADERGEQA